MKNREEIKQKIESMSKEELVDLFINNENNEEQLNWYKEQMAMLNKLRFSSKSEKVISGQLNLFNEIEDIADNSETIVEDTAPTKVKKKKQKEANFAKLPTRIIEHKLEDTHCEVCGTELKELAPQTIDVLKYQPARYVVERHIVHQYICPTCTDGNLEAEITIAPGAPKRLIKGSVVSPSVVAGIAFNKYVDGTPLYRQEQELKRKKVEVSRANMSNWLMSCGKKLEPLFELMHKDIKTLNHIHMDETTVTVLEDRKEGRQNSYMWIGCSGKWEAKQMALYFYHESREYSYAKELIGERYAGGIHCDGYEAYHKFDKASIYGCMAHARRKFIEAMEVDMQHSLAKKLKKEQLSSFYKEHPSYANIVKIIDQIKYLFHQEQVYMEESLLQEEITKRRQEEQKPILDELFKNLEQYQDEYSKQSKMGKAIQYACNQREYLSNYLNDGAAELSNNRGERAVKPFVTGRKNWLFSNTKSGAKMSSIYYSLIESAKMNHLDIHEYLEYILEEIQNNENMDYQKLLPYSNELPEHLRIR